MEVDGAAFKVKFKKDNFINDRFRAMILKGTRLYSILNHKCTKCRK
jgi:hypothetical protein